MAYIKIRAICTPTVFVKAEGAGVRRSFGASGPPSPRRAKGARSKPARARYRVGYIASIAPIVQRWTGRAGFDGAAFSGQPCGAARCGAGSPRESTSPASKQFSGHASLKSLEEYAKLEKLRQNRLLRDVPLTRARRSSAPACPASFVGRRGRVGQGDQALDETVKRGRRSPEEAPTATT
jgi:hypothetical protein